jgi:hypothetical protein
MAKVWVLDTDTKGTGAEMVPLDRALEKKRSAPGNDRVSVIRRGRDHEPARDGDPDESGPRAPRRFKVVNAIRRQVLAEGIGAREVVELLEGIPSLADARVYVWEPEAEDWRPLTLREQKTLRASSSRKGVGVRP